MPYPCREQQPRPPTTHPGLDPKNRSSLDLFAGTWPTRSSRRSRRRREPRSRRSSDFRTTRRFPTGRRSAPQCPSQVSLRANGDKALRNGLVPMHHAKLSPQASGRRSPGGRLCRPGVYRHWQNLFLAPLRPVLPGHTKHQTPMLANAAPSRPTRKRQASKLDLAASYDPLCLNLVAGVVCTVHECCQGPGLETSSKPKSRNRTASVKISSVSDLFLPLDAKVGCTWSQKQHGRCRRVLTARLEGEGLVAAGREKQHRVWRAQATRSLLDKRIDEITGRTIETQDTAVGSAIHIEVPIRSEPQGSGVSDHSTVRRHEDAEELSGGPAVLQNRIWPVARDV